MLYEKNADEKRLIASLTKIMTALVVLERTDPEETVCVRPEWTDVEGSKMGLVPGETLTVGDLLKGVLLSSGNDAALALAEHCAGSAGAFAEMMNEQAAELGLDSTRFENPHGLDGPEQYSTARDLAALAAAAMSNADFAAIVGMRSASAAGRTLVNHNKLLDMLEGCVGVKTGYTDAAGRTLVSCVEREGMRLICVTLCDGNDWNDHIALCGWALDSFEAVSPLEALAISPMPVISGEAADVALVPERPCRLLCPKGAELEVRIEKEKFIYAPVLRGEPAGKARVYVGEVEADCVPLVCASGVALDRAIPLTAWEKIKWAWYLVHRHTPYIYPMM
ncbi:MAG: D-alanyl-D-alanine carboxypeptidase [Oscillospiraceae bacterium]|nr:D-alanyl-D-alanine carboxypeptidase [Oscillospiraceae bacterium]